MTKRASVLIVGSLLVAAYSGGAWRGRQATSGKTAAASTKVQYYACPMHLQYRSTRPGDCMACGMRLEPVSDGKAAGSQAGGGKLAPSLPPGTVQVSPEKQQMIGVRVSAVKPRSVSRTLRTTGRVAIDETSLYRLVAGEDGRVVEVNTAATGDIVKKGQVLATCYTSSLLNLEQAYIIALNTEDRLKELQRGPLYEGGPTITGVQATRSTAGRYVLPDVQIRTAEQSLLTLGMCRAQLDEIARTREIAPSFRVCAPCSGVIISRDMYSGQSFEQGTEWFRLADLSRVWILADVFAGEAGYFKPGRTVRASVPGHGKRFKARVSDAVPQFVEAASTLRVRLEAPNPRYALRPGEFVDIEVPVQTRASAVVPAEAVLDSGLRKTVFVDRGGGHFEPREVQAGWRAGGQVQITRGLKAGERVVVSGTFLLDSESRMRLADQPRPSAALPTDPICGMKVDKKAATAAGNTSKRDGKTYYFCCRDCKRRFDARAVEAPARPAAAAQQQRDPVCGMLVDPRMAPGGKSQYRGKVYYFCMDSCRQEFEQHAARYISQAGGSE